MSTACVSAFYDVGDVLFQNRNKHLLRRGDMQLSVDRKAVGTPIMGSQNNQNMLNRNRNHSSSMSMGSPSSVTSSSSGFSSPDRYSPSTVASMNSMGGSMQGSPVLGRESLLNSHRKLDRSVSEPVGDRNSNQQQQRNSNINSSRYKTELCRPFEESGYCKYGDKCQFAHGAHETRSLARHPKYKTELCRTFHTTGFCPYGPRCHFIHNEDERRLNQINQLKQQQAVPEQQQQQQQQPRQMSQSQAQPIRPKALNFSLSMPMVRDSLGSTADSPPSSFTDSPTMSPTFMADDFLGGVNGFIPGAFSPASSAGIPPQSAPPAVNGPTAFTFQELQACVQANTTATLLGPLNVQTDSMIASLAAGLQAATLNQRNNNYHQAQPQQQHIREVSNDVFWTPPSPPDSINGDSISSGTPCGSTTCGSPLDVSRGLRLPIFSRLSCDM